MESKKTIMIPMVNNPISTHFINPTPKQVRDIRIAPTLILPYDRGEDKRDLENMIQNIRRNNTNPKVIR